MTRGLRFRVGEIAWIDLTSTDLEASVRFYSAMFGWSIPPGREEEGGYRLANLGGERVAGLLAADPSQPVDAWTVYLAVDDVETRYAQAIEAGATPLVPPFPLAEHGRAAFLADPGGAACGLWERAAESSLGVIGAPGSLGWAENHTKRFDRMVEFAATFWHLDADRLTDGDDFRYATCHVDGDEAAIFGIFDASGSRGDDDPSAWVVYFAVDDADQAAARAVEHGASLTFGPADSPYGRMATLVDPVGAAFNLIELDDPSATHTAADVVSATCSSAVAVDDGETAAETGAQTDGATGAETGTQTAAEADEETDAQSDAVSPHGEDATPNDEAAESP